jgi:RNA polymerase sigma-70 factor (ECF subfamily)
LLYFRYAEQLLSLAAGRLGGDLAGRLDPEDIVQSVFRTFFRRAALGQFEVPQGEDMWKLLLVIALNKIRARAGHHRAARRDVRRTLQPEPERPLPEASDDGDDAALSVLRLTVEEVLQRLPPTHRTIVERRIEGHEVAEIAELVGRSKRSVERALQEVRADLHAAIHEGR